jgi:4-hydroxythreonine-4-phosphate dehydrogenase
MEKIKVAITLGDPSGVGPEIVARVCNDPLVLQEVDPLVVGRADLLAAGAESCGLPAPEVELFTTGGLDVVDPGRPSAAGGRLAGAFVEKALALCLSGRADAMATAPLSKEALQAGGYPDTGHTTLLARLTGTTRPVMMLAGSSLRVVLATIHCALREVPERLTIQGIVEVGSITAAEMRAKMGIESPRLAVAALNPHAGESGLFGDEEETIITPAIKKLQAAGIRASGPHPPDTLFWRAAHGQFDAVLAMYHDQGLIPLKLLHFEDAVNLTLGLPIIRTSVDHGTAYDLAGQGRANPASLKAAVLLAADMARRVKG